MNSKTSDQALEGSPRAGGADGSLGEQLRRARESRGVSLREISEQTRITMRHLEAIESDDYKHLPGGIFNRSFIKAYARYIHFDEQRALDLYARAARERGEPAEEALTSPQRSRIYTDGDTGRSPLTTFILSALMVGVLILVVYGGLRYYRRAESASGGAQPTPTPAAAQNGPAPAESPAAQTQPVVADRLDVTVRTNGEAWLRVLADDQTSKNNAGAIWQPGQTQEFTPQQKLTLNYAKSLAGALEVTANGTRLRVPTDTKPGISQEWVITKDNYKQFAQ